MTLEEAQRAKVRRICEKLDLGPDDHVLEIGCGWGGFAIQAATEYGCRVTGLTLSPSQAEPRAGARRGRRALTTASRSASRTTGSSRGGSRRSRRSRCSRRSASPSTTTTSRTIDRLLTRGGLACIQTIGVPDWRFERYRRRPDWIQQTIFPGSLLPSLEAIAKAVAATQLQINGVEEIGFGYARTLREWRENVDRNVDRIRALGYDERFLRLWHFYLTYCEAGFAIRSLRDMQIVLSHSANDSLPEFPRGAAGVLSYEAYRALADAGGSCALPARGSRASSDCSRRRAARVVGNHDSILDPFIVSAAISAADSLPRRSPSCGAFRCCPGGSPASRRSRWSEARVTSRAIAAGRVAALERARPSGSFREGGVMRDGPWLRGAARMALATGAPILPVRLLETREGARTSSFGFPRLAALIGEPIVVPRDDADTGARLGSSRTRSRRRSRRFAVPSRDAVGDGASIAAPGRRLRSRHGSRGGTLGDMPGRRFGADTITEPPERPGRSRRAQARTCAASSRSSVPTARQLAVVFRLIVFSAALGVIPPFLLRGVLDTAIPENDVRLLTLLVAGMIVIPIVTGAIGVFQTLLSNQVGQRVMHDLRTSVYRHLQRLSLAFFTRTRTGEVQWRIANDIGGIDTVVTIDRDLDALERDDRGRDDRRDGAARLAARRRSR